MNAKIAAIAIIIPPNPVSIGILSAPIEIGVSDIDNSDGSTSPIVMNITTKYSKEIIPHARNIPSGIFLPGFLHSSATLHTLVSPPNEGGLR